MGATGNEKGLSVYFEVRINGNTINLYDYVFKGKTIDSINDYTEFITYQAYAGGKWQNEVNKCDKSDGSYAGILCVPLEFVKLTNTK